MKARRWSDTATFRADPAAAQVSRPSRRQTVALLVVLTLIAGAVVAASYLVRPEKARAFDLVHGSVFLEDTYAPVGIDLATGKPTLRLVDAAKQVGATRNNQLSVVPLQDATLLLNNGTDNANSGEFNEVDDTGFVTKPDGSGVPLSKRSDHPESIGFADTGSKQAAGSAYIERSGPSGTDVFLVTQSTVQSAAGTGSNPKPRASVSFDDVGLTRTGAGASANGDLWLLAGSGNRPVLEQLSVPANSNPGVRLTIKTHGTVDATAGIGVASAVDSDTADVVGVAQPGSITLYLPGGKTKKVQTASADGVRTILPATNQDDRLAYLERDARGWRAVSVRSDGSDQRTAELTGIPAEDDLAQPAHSGDALYTVDKTNGQVYAIALENDSARRTVVAPYPKQTGEAASLGDAYLVGRGPRVIVNSPGHTEALVVFTDDSRAPLVVRKSQAVTINAGATATTYTQDKVDQTNQRPTKSGGTAAPRSQPISTRVDCATVNQKPHIPTITSATPSARSVALAWTYPLLDQQDCAPSTYVVNVKLLSNDAPKPEGSVRIQGQQSVNLAGLYPSTRYQITVAAYLNKLSTTSTPVTFTTGPEGPAAPTGVRVSADSSGNWTVSWQGCGAVAQGCVPAASWRVIPSLCDGVGLSGTPAVLNAPADPTTKAQAPAVYKGGDNLLGRGLSFQIQGTGEQGQAGSLSAKSACVYSWTTPNAGATTLHASSPANTNLGGTSSTNVTLNLGANPTRNVGGYGAKIALTLSGDGTTQTKSFTFNGNQSVIGATFGGVHSGALYTASATITPAHGGGMGTVSPVTVQTRANWPATSLSANCDSSGLLTCTLSVDIHGISSADARGEKFTFEGDLTCGSAGKHFTESGIDPAARIVVGDVSQADGFYGNSCKVTGTLRETSNASPLVFGGTTTPVQGTGVSLPGPTTLNASAGDFTAGWDGNNVVVKYTGSGNLDALTTGWSETVVAPGGASCGSASSQPTASVAVDPACVQAHGGDKPWQLTISYANKIGGGSNGPFTLTLATGPPNYVPPVCTPNLSAAWGPTQADGVMVSNTGKIDNCTNWSYSLVDSSGNTVCSDATATGAPPVTIHYTSCGTPPDGSWQVKVTYQDVNSQTQTAALNIPGNPPGS